MTVIDTTPVLDEIATNLSEEEQQEQAREDLAVKLIAEVMRGYIQNMHRRLGQTEKNIQVKDLKFSEDGDNRAWGFEFVCNDVAHLGHQSKVGWVDHYDYLPDSARGLFDFVNFYAPDVAGGAKCPTCKRLRDRLPGFFNHTSDGRVDWEFRALKRRLGGGQVRWLIPGVMEEGKLISLFGPPKSGKSILALEWAIQMANDSRRVLYLDEENDPDDVQERAEDMGWTIDGVGYIDYRSFPGWNVDEMPGQGGEDEDYRGSRKTEQIHPIVALAESISAEVVIFDSWGKFFASGTQSSDSSVLLAYRYVLKPLRARGIAVIRLDHTGHAEASRPFGSSQKLADVDHNWLIKAESAPGRSARGVTLTHTENRTGNGEDVIRYQRLLNPLRHVLIGQGAARGGAEPGEDPVDYLVRRLDQLGIPLDWSNKQAGEALRGDGDRVGAANLAEAIRRRRSQPLPQG